MRVLLLGSGGREHALAAAIVRSPQCDALAVAPGNAGTQTIANNLDFDPCQADAVLSNVRKFAADLVVVGPEAPLAAGVTDELREQGVRVFGPSRSAAQLEASKSFANEICDAAGIPTATWRKFTTVQPALAYLRNCEIPIVVKADGLAAGKGVVVAATRGDAEDAVREMFAGGMGAAGTSVVIESFLPGQEASLFAICGRKKAVSFGTARDYKRAYEQDQGPNTGGMGVVSPAPTMTAEVADGAMERIVLPCLHAMAARGTPYTGILYVGLMIDAGMPSVVEFNVRLGDPEAQGLMPRLTSDLLAILDHATSDTLGEWAEPTWDDRHTVTVVLASKGYPGAYESGTEIRQLESAAAQPDVVIHHAGTRYDNDRLVAVGGRVLNVTGLGESILAARQRAYAAVDMIDWPEGFCRRDIGL